MGNVTRNLIFFKALYVFTSRNYLENSLQLSPHLRSTIPLRYQFKTRVKIIISPYRIFRELGILFNIFHSMVTKKKYQIPLQQFPKGLSHQTVFPRAIRTRQPTVCLLGQNFHDLTVIPLNVALGFLPWWNRNVWSLGASIRLITL